MNDVKPKLVVLCGFPCSGKSTLAKNLSEDCGFVILNPDSIRQEMGYSFNPFIEDCAERERLEFYELEEIMLHTINLRKHQSILQGKNVVVDSCAIYEKTRENFLFSPMAKKYLVYLEVEKNVLMQRNKEKNLKDFEKSFEILKRKYWQEPAPSSNYVFLKFANNGWDDYKAMFEKVKKTVFNDEI